MASLPHACALVLQCSEKTMCIKEGANTVLLLGRAKHYSVEVGFAVLSSSACCCKGKDLFSTSVEILTKRLCLIFHAEEFEQHGGTRLLTPSCVDHSNPV